MNNKKSPPGLGHNRPKKSEKERSKTYNERKKEAGYRKVWVDPATLGRIDDLGSIEEVSAHHANLERNTRYQAQQIEELDNTILRLSSVNSELNLTLKKQTHEKNLQIDELQKQGQEQAREIIELKEGQENLAEKNTNLERTAQERSDLIANQMSALDSLRADLEAERNRTLFERLVSSLFRK